MASTHFRVRPIEADAPSQPVEAVLTPADAERLALLAERSETWLVERVLHYAQVHGFTQHASPRRSDWHAAVAGLSAALAASVRNLSTVPATSATTDPVGDPICAFGVLEAQRHRARGVPLELFFGLMKYFRQAYRDLCAEDEGARDRARREGWQASVDRTFDRIELGFVSEWLHSSSAARLEELQDRNRLLAVENARYNTLFETLSSPVLVLSADGAVRRLNEAARRTLGVGEPGLHLPWLDAVLPGATGEPPRLRHFELELQQGNALRSFEGVVAPLPDLTPDLAGSVVVLLDVTERERVRRELVAARDELEDRVAERTAELQAANLRLRAEISERQRAEEEREQIREQLFHAQKLEAIGTLAGGVAHDINNLVQIILGSTDLLAVLGDVSDRDRVHLEHIAHAAERAGSLVRQLLVFSRKQPITPRPVDLDALIGDLLRMLQRLLGPDIAVDLDLQAGHGATLADPGGVEQLLMNLVVNARDAMQGSGRLRIRSRPLVLEAAQARMQGLPEGAYVELQVSDTGVGMAPETLDRIFEPFFTTKPSGLGTGLGLAVAYGVVQQHGGAISVDSRQGQGTTFHVLLPALPGAHAAAADEAPRPRGAGERVLLVEDREAVRAVTEQILASYGYQVTTAADAADAHAVLDRGEGPFDLLLSDVILPGTTGDELARELRARQVGLPVLFMSGHVHLNGERSLEHPLLHKPFSTSELLRAVRSRLDEPEEASPPSRRSRPEAAHGLEAP